MAFAGLNSFSAISSTSVILESQSPLSKWCATRQKPCNQASLRQMWRELEVEQITDNSLAQGGVRAMQGSVVQLNTEFSTTFLSTGGNVNSLIDSNEKENEHVISSRRLQNEHDDSRSSSSESVNFGRLERERVREVFREWQNNGLRNNTTRESRPNNYSKAKWLGEQECERVRIVRDWVENTTQQRGRSHGGREGQDAETGAQIDRVREGLRRRTIHRLCGRQTLLDLVTRAENEREKELQDLLNHRHVSDFPYRNRIQSSLKGRFLREKTYKQEEKPSSIAASELGILRQKQITVSDIREGFLSSKLENFVCGPVRSVQSDTSSDNDVHCYRNEHTQASSLQHIVQDRLCSQSEPTSEETDTDISYIDDSESGVSEGLHQQESEALVCESHVVLERVDREQLSSTGRFNFWRTFASENSQRNSADGRCPETLGIEGSQETHLSVTQGSDHQNNVIDAPSASGDIVQLEGTLIEDMNWQNIHPESEDWKDSVVEDGDIDWVQLSNSNYTGWRQTSEDGTETDSHASSQRQYNDSEHYNLQVPHEEWHDTTSNDARDDWRNEPSVEEVATVYTSHFSDDNNGQSLELRQLQSRRTVSNLLRSDFRASLDQLIQSYVERQDHAPVDWEVEGVSSSLAAVMEEEQEQPFGHLRMGHSEALLGTTLPTVSLPSQQISSSQSVWDHNDYQQQVNSLQHSRNDCEIVNELKVDIAGLHQRMNSMQMMLEACMDMQLDLQRSVRQELSAALNWQSRSTDCEYLVPDESDLEHVKNGVCCVCRDAKIDSLLYRCGHMCACSNCAQKLVEGKDKCPMCRAPVIEVIRAYSIQ